MTDLGKLFAFIAKGITDKHGLGSNKMAHGYTVYEKDGFELNEYVRKEAEQFEQLVSMGYLRKFITDPHLTGQRKHHVRFMVRDVCFGLTQKGWEVAPKYLAAYEREDRLATAELKAKNYYEKVKDTKYAVTYEEALDMAMRHVL